jgi:2,5-furandicarboxylate decarboxylase 1
MRYPDLRGFLADLGGDLLTVRQAFDPKHEMAALLRAMPGNGPAVLFENVSGHPGARVVGNLVASRKRVARALDTSEAELNATYLLRSRQGIAPRQTDDAPVKEATAAPSSPPASCCAPIRRPAVVAWASIA